MKRILRDLVPKRPTRGWPVGRSVERPVTASSDRSRQPDAALDRRDSVHHKRLVVVIAGLTIAAAALRLHTLLVPGRLLGQLEYDDGVYFGSALQLIEGRLPYRNFVAVWPPMIVVLMSPFAFLAKVIGTANALGVIRVLTALIGAASVPLMGRLVKHRGVGVVVVACSFVAFQPGAVQSSSTLLLEPWLVFFSLVAAVLIFDHDRLAGNTRLLWGGVALGVAGATKVWAIIPVLVVAALCVPAGRRLARFGLGVAAGFLVPVLPFAVRAPRAFVHDVVISQLQRDAGANSSQAYRLSYLLGINISRHTGAVFTVAAVALGVLLCLSWAAMLRAHRRLPSPLEWFALVTTALVVIAMLAPPAFYYHYAGFFAPFAALSLALPVAGLTVLDWRRAAWAAVAATLLAAVTVNELYEAGHVTSPDPRVSAARSVIPAGACVLTNEASLTIAADRFLSTRSDCPAIVDPLGTALAVTGGHVGRTGARTSPRLRALWAQAVRHADFLWMRPARDAEVAYTPRLRRYIRARFFRISGPGLPNRLYERRSYRSGRATGP